MRQRQLVILLLGLTFAPGSPAPAQQPQRPPRVVAFVVGIEQYKEARLNSLEYVGEDAYRVWNGLKAISEFDESRSTILVADRVRTGDLPPRTAETLTRDHITTELERFLGRTRSGDTAVLYFGGHGKVAFEGYGVSLLASNFADDGFVNAIFMRRVIEDARARTASKNVPIVVLANMCHAGAPGVYDPDQTPTLHEMSDAGEKDVPKTSKPVAYIPAAGGETTYETKSLGGSLFVHHLESALQGGAADEYGRVTTGSLIRTLQARISEIPRIGAFDDSIVVGRTGRQEAVYRRTLGIALLAAAFDDADNPQLLRLAESQFARAADRWQSTSPANLLSLAEVRFLLGRESDALETLNVAQQEAAANGDAGVTRRIAALRAPGSKPSTAALSVLLLDGYGRVRAGSSTPSDAALWLEMFKRLPQHRQSARIDVPFPASTGPDGVLAQSEKVVNGWRQAAAPDDMLVVVYSGVAALWDSRSASSSRADDLRPVSGADLWTLARLWEGPVVVIFDAPFGGVVKRSVPADLTPRTALWLSAGQENGMTFGGGRLPQEGTTALMVEATRAGLSGESIKELAERHRVLFADSEGPDFQIGVPEWLGPLHAPFWSTTHTTLARNEMLKWSWWSDSVASGGRLDVAAEDLSPVALRNLRSARTAAAAGRWREATRLLADLAHLPAVALRLAALHEILGDHDAARAHYDRYLTAAAAAGTRPPATMPETTAVVERARERQGRFVERIRQRAGALTPARSRIHVVGVAVQEYVLPEIGDLALPAHDILMWEQALKKGFGDRVVVHPVLRDRSVADIRAALETIAAETTEHELVVLVYSGRGLEQDGQKYLTGADSRLTRQDQFQVVASTWDTTRLIAVSEVARTFANRDLVMVMDAQLSAPRRDEMSARHKHIASIQGGEADAPFIDPGPTRRYPAPAELRRHLYVWWEGVLGEPLVDDTDVDGGAASPLTRALVQTLPGGETYGEWLERAGSLLRTGDEGRADAFGRLAVQGPEHRPLMSAGVSLEQAVHLALQVDRTEANLELGSSWAEQHAKVWSLPDDRLARAALLVSLGRVQLSQGANGTAAFERAIVLLDEMRREAAALARQGLLIDYVHWYTAALDEGLQDPDRALGALIEIIGDDRDRQPAPELVARLLQLTERAASTTATEKLRRSRDLLRSLRRDDAQLDSAIGRLESLLREQLRGSRGAGITMQ